MEYTADIVLQRVVLVEVEKLQPGGHAFDPDNAKPIGTNAAHTRLFVVVVVVKRRPENRATRD